MQIQKLENYCKTMLLDFEIEDEYLSLNDKDYKIITDVNRTLVNDKVEFLEGVDQDDDADGYVYEFGGRWYLQDSDQDRLQLKELKYIGDNCEGYPTKSFLGIRSGYELMNGMGLYPEWINKAKFLGTTTLGICERKSLSGVLAFQNECIANGIKSVIGMTIPTKGVESYDIKLYVKSFQGWQSLLRLNEKLNVHEEREIEEEFLIKNSNDLFVVADPKFMNYKLLSKAMSNRIDFYQLDTVNFLNEEYDAWYLNNLKDWILNDQQLKPISIADAFYLEQRDFKTREAMWSIGKAFDHKTDNQFFKSKTQFAAELINLFKKGNKGFTNLFNDSINNEQQLADQCNFIYDTDSRHLPKYIMTPQEADEYEDNSDLFISLITKGFKQKGITDKKYIERLAIEIEVLKSGDVIDYFLALHDIIQYAKSQKMLTGIGRGSAGGSLVAYLLGIIQVDPLEFDLLFERFLNSGRMGSWKDRPSYAFEDDDGNSIELAEGEFARIIRDKQEKIVYCHEIIEGDEIVKY